MNESENSINDMSIMPIAGLLRRLAALIYDLFLLAAMVMAYALLVITPLRISLYGMPSNDDNWAGFPIFIKVLLILGLIFVLAAYYFVCWRKQGQSMGMKAWRLKLQQSNGKLANASQCWSRALLAPISLAFFGIGFLWCLIPPNNECLHDRLTGTKVVVLPKSK